MGEDVAFRLRCFNGFKELKRIERKSEFGKQFGLEFAKVSRRQKYLAWARLSLELEPLALASLPPKPPNLELASFSLER
ncbi:hypothetical protein Ahy_B10g102391 isoform B [Arachis hypogaea]|uniref:Uncharacterized protein n=1 Tax=Arachis hypogaea TaxID=3818 RepID=A0A444X203_ARAHY|nr:hypothetical protein Ahy_B10g102391 isoform B [Arachis hypogaea]